MYGFLRLDGFIILYTFYDVPQCIPVIYLYYASIVGTLKNQAVIAGVSFPKPKLIGRGLHGCDGETLGVRDRSQDCTH
jgi:hypothetical protein